MFQFSACECIITYVMIDLSTGGVYLVPIWNFTGQRHTTEDNNKLYKRIIVFLYIIISY